MNNDDVSPIDDTLPEFVSYLADRLGLDRASALHTVGDWLVHYEPIKRQAIDTLEPQSALRSLLSAGEP